MHIHIHIKAFTQAIVCGVSFMTSCRLIHFVLVSLLENCHLIIPTCLTHTKYQIKIFPRNYTSVEFLSLFLCEQDYYKYLLMRKYLNHLQETYISTLREKCPNTEFSLVRIFRIRSRKSSVFGHFSHSANFDITFDITLPTLVVKQRVDLYFKLLSKETVFYPEVISMTSLKS